MHRICPVCDSVLPKNKRTDAIYCSSYCGKRNRNRRYELAHPDKVALNRYKQNMKTEQRMLARTKYRASKTEVPFDIAVEDISIPERCPILDIPLVRYRGGKTPAGYYPDSPSIDRIEPHLGYVRGNVRVISARANLLKNNASIEELMLILEDLKNIRR